MRELGRRSLYFLLRYILGRADIEHPWLLARCIEVERAPNGFLDLWARDHYKSTVITFGKTIQDVLASHGDDPLPEWGGREVTVGIFSHTRPIAKSFLRQIKRELERNQLLRELYPDILHENPERDAAVWSLDDGLVVQRKANPKEATIEAWGLVDGQPTGKHYLLRVYDDVVTRRSVHTPAAVRNTTDAWALSLNLGTKGGVERYIGTRYALGDTYHDIIERAAAVPRIHAATHDGTMEGRPVLLDADALATKRRTMGPYVFGAQMMQNPVADATQGFKAEWFQHYRDYPPLERMNVYMIVDPAGQKKKTSDYTSFMVIGLADDQNYYMLDMVRDRLNLTERGAKLLELHRQWRPMRVGYERYGMQADIDYIKELQQRENYRFPIVELGGTMGNEDRVRRLVPSHEEGRWWYPASLRYRDYEGSVRDLVQVFRDEEFIPFPVGVHADMMDAQSRVLDDAMGARFPREPGYRGRWRSQDAPEHARAAYRQAPAMRRGDDAGDYA